MIVTRLETVASSDWVVLIHGLGVSQKVWLSPLEEKVLFISFRTLLRDEEEMVPFAERLKGLCNVATWTQDRESTIDEAANQLGMLMTSLEGCNVILIAHSRGGLVARRAIQNHHLAPKALICLSSPHFGSGLADLTLRHMSGLRRLVPSVARMEAPIEELCMTAPLIRETNSPGRLAAESHVPHFDVAGDSTAYFNMGISLGKMSLDLFRVMGSMERILGSHTIEEWRNGKGDGFVRVDSARSPLTPDEAFFRVAVNHANILIDNRVWGIVNSILQKRFVS